MKEPIFRGKMKDPIYINKALVCYLPFAGFHYSTYPLEVTKYMEKTCREAWMSNQTQHKPSCVTRFARRNSKHVEQPCE